MYEEFLPFYGCIIFHDTAEPLMLKTQDFPVSVYYKESLYKPLGIGFPVDTSGHASGINAHKCLSGHV